MEIHQLEMLRELGALGSVKAVAETLLVTPSAVSQQLAALQKSVEVPLTRKEGRSGTLTFAVMVTEFHDRTGRHVATARLTGVETA